MWRRTALCLIVSFALLLAQSAGAGTRDRPIVPERANHTKMRTYNVGVAAFFAVFSAMRQGQIHSWRDIWKHLAIGGGAGAAFYEAKRLAGDGKVTAGWLLANATSSIAENAAAGEHPIGRLGYTLGPMRFRVATPYARTGLARIDAAWSAAETVNLAYALNDGDSVSFRNGLITVDRETPWESDGRMPGGVTYGVFPGVTPDAPRSTWYHEVVHVIQSQQADAVEAPIYTFRKDRENAGPRPLFALRHVKLGYVQSLENITQRRPYVERWNEVEAYWLANDSPVEP